MSPGGEAAAERPLVLIYDGRCAFCEQQSRRLLKLARPGSVERVDAHAPGVLERFAGLVTFEQAMVAMQLVELGRRPRVFRGCEAAVRVLATRRWVGLLAHVYYLPVVRWLCEMGYGWIARNRYRIRVRVRGERCESGACPVHGAGGGG